MFVILFFSINIVGRFGHRNFGSPPGTDFLDEYLSLTKTGWRKCEGGGVAKL